MSKRLLNHAPSVLYPILPLGVLCVLGHFYCVQLFCVFPCFISYLVVSFRFVLPVQVTDYKDFSEMTCNSGAQLIQYEGSPRDPQRSEVKIRKSGNGSPRWSPMILPGTSY